MAILFPPSLAQHLHLGTTEGAPESTLEVKTLTGPPVLLQRGRSQHRPISGRLLLRSDAELDLFQEWFLDTLGSGSKKFQWHRPGRDGDEVLEMQFTGDRYSIAGDLATGYRLSLSLMIVRRVS